MIIKNYITCGRD